MSSNPFLLEFIINLRWALHFFVSDLEYSVNNHYPQLVADAMEVLTVLSTSHATLSTLGSVPLGALQLAKEGCVYLLVSEGILGSCPPTTHAFLLQNRGTKIYSSSTSSAPSSLASAGEGQPPQQGLGSHASSTRNIAAGRPLKGGNGYGGGDGEGHSKKTHPQSPERCRRSLDTSVCTDLISSITDPAVFEQASHHSRLRPAVRGSGTMGDRPPTASTFTTTNTSTNKQTDDLRSLQKDDQAMFLLLRWLISEQILATAELATTLEVDVASAAQPEGGVDARRAPHSHRSREHHSSRRPRSKSFKEQSLMAVKMAQLVPFYLGAHVLVTRSIYMAHCLRLLSVEDVAEHVKALRPECVALDVAPPGSGGEAPSIEQAVVVWTATALHLLLCDLLNQQAFVQQQQQQQRRQQHPQPTEDSESKALAQLKAAITAARGLHAKLQDCSPSLFFAHIQDGVALLLLLYVYQKDIVALADIQFPVASETSEARTKRSLANWLTIIRVAQKLGLWVGFYAEELVYNYGGPLTLHLFAFVQKLFMVLATLAEEGARTTLDEEGERTTKSGSRETTEVAAGSGGRAWWDGETAPDSVARSAIMSSTRRRQKQRQSERGEVSVQSRASSSYNDATIPSTVHSTSINDRSAFSSPDKKSAPAATRALPQGPYEAVSKKSAPLNTTLDSSVVLRPLVKRAVVATSVPGSGRESDDWTSRPRVVQAKRREKPNDFHLDEPVTRNTSVNTVATSVSALTTAGSPPFGTVSYPMHRPDESAERTLAELHPSERLLAALTSERTDGSVRTPRPEVHNVSGVSATSTDAVTMNRELGWSNVNVSKSTVAVDDSWLPELAVSAERGSGFHTPPAAATPPRQPKEAVEAAEAPPTICSTGKVSEAVSRLQSTPGSMRQPPPELLWGQESPTGVKAMQAKAVSAPHECSSAADKSDAAGKDLSADEEDDEDFVVQAAPRRINSFHQVALSSREEEVSSSSAADEKRPLTPRVVVVKNIIATQEAKSPSPLSPCGSLHTCSGPRTDSNFSAPFRSQTQDNAKSKSHSVPDSASAPAAAAPLPSKTQCSAEVAVPSVAPRDSAGDHSVEGGLAMFASAPPSAPNRAIDTDTYDASVIVDPTPSQVSYHNESDMSGYTGSVAASSVRAASLSAFSHNRNSGARRDMDEESYVSAYTKASTSLNDLRHLSNLSNLEAALAGDDKETLMQAVQQLQRINSQLVDRLQAREGGSSKSRRTPGDSVLASPTRSLFQSSTGDRAWPRDGMRAVLRRPAPGEVSVAQMDSRQSLTPLSRRGNLSTRLDMTVESMAPGHSPGDASYKTNMSAQLAETDVSSVLNSRMDKSDQL